MQWQELARLPTQPSRTVHWWTSQRVFGRPAIHALFTISSYPSASHQLAQQSRVWQSKCRLLLAGRCRTWPRDRKKFTNHRQALTSYDQRGGSMERRYLVATLALVATFAIFSREFRTGHLANLPCSRAELRADLACAKHYVADQLRGEGAALRRPRRSRRAADDGGVESAGAGRGQRKGCRGPGTDRATDGREEL